MTDDNCNPKWRTFTFKQALILLALLAQAELSAPNRKDTFNRTEYINKTIDALKMKLKLKQNNMRDLLQNLADFITDEVDETNFNINNVYQTIMENECYSTYKQCFCDKIVFEKESDIRTTTTQPTQQPQTEYSDEIVNEFLTATGQNNYDKAAQSLLRIGDDNNVLKAVVEIYQREGDNSFNLLLNTCQKFTDLKKRLSLYNAIHKEMGRWEPDGFKFLQIVDNINKGIVLNKNADQDTVLNAKRLIKVLQFKAEFYASKFIKAAFLDKNSTNIKTGNKLLNYMYNVNECLFERVHQKYLSSLEADVYNDAFNKLLDLTKSRNNIKQEYLLYIIKLYRIRESDPYTDNTFTELCNQYKKIQEEMKSRLDEITFHKYSNKLKTVLPTSMGTMMTARKVCIRNVGLNEYLNTGGGNSLFYLQDSSRRTAYTSAKNSHDGFGFWEIQHINNDIYYLHSVDMDENMYTSVGTFLGDRHVVWLWIPGREIDVHYEWNFELSGDHVYIKSTRFGEYLYGSSRTENSIPEWQNGHVYTLTNKSKDCPNKYCLWSLEDCTDTK